MARTLSISLPDEEGTVALGRRLAALLRPGDVVLLEGDLGAGKTFLVRAVARGLGVPEDVPVTSPTFALVHELPARFPVLHADLYRLSNPDELIELGLLDRAAEEALLLVEWGERFERDLGEVAIVLRLDITGPGAREATLSARSRRGLEVVEALARG